MTNENNNINELVTKDDDPTAALEILSNTEGAACIEANAKTHNADETDDQGQPVGVSVSALRSDLVSRKKIIGRLQYDIEQLHAKWLGLEAEVSARESQTIQINKDLTATQKAIARNEKLIKKRDLIIQALKAEIRQRDEDYRLLKTHLDELMLNSSDTTSGVRDDAQASEELISRLRRTEEYADSIRKQSHDLIEENTSAGREIESLSSRLTEGTERNAEVSKRLSTATSDIEELQSTLSQIQKRHEDEIRILRFELGDAQSTIIQTEELTTQITSDLVDARSFNAELERMLRDAEEQSSDQIDQLQRQVAQLTRKAGSFEQKLTAKSEAISVLLAELANKSDQDDSIGEIEGAIKDIDDRMSEHDISGDKVSRVLVGTVEDKMLRFPLFKNRLTIGRTDDNDIQIKAVYVSRRHAVIQTDGDVTRIIDWGSKNGIQVNSAKVTEHFLCHGDTLLIGNARFRYEERKKRDSH